MTLKPTITTKSWGWREDWKATIYKPKNIYNRLVELIEEERVVIVEIQINSFEDQVEEITQNRKQSSRYN